MIGNSITERISIHKFALCFLERFGWIEREQYVTDQGIDTQVEIVENGNIRSGGRTCAKRCK
jgi:histone deacetylase complex regulatory component SIN3